MPPKHIVGTSTRLAQSNACGDTSIKSITSFAAAAVKDQIRPGKFPSGSEWLFSAILQPAARDTDGLGSLFTRPTVRPPVWLADATFWLTLAAAVSILFSIAAFNILLALALVGVYLAYHWENGRLTVNGRTKAAK